MQRLSIADWSARNGPKAASLFAALPRTASEDPILATRFRLHARRRNASATRGSREPRRATVRSAREQVAARGDAARSDGTRRAFAAEADPGVSTNTEVREMARSTAKSRGTRKSTRARSSRDGAQRTRRNGNGNGNGSADNAIALLKRDHREVEDLFGRFEDDRSGDRKVAIAMQICAALRAHTTIEEEIFYPAFLDATGERDIHHEAEVEHEGAKNLIAEIEGMDSGDEYYDAKVTVLREMIKHHVNEEEKRGGMFAKARSSDMDLGELGERLRKRKEEIMQETGSAERDRDGRMPTWLHRRASSRDQRERKS
jgi:hemerythrin HHE cation binding domain-containing protein